MEPVLAGPRDRPGSPDPENTHRATLLDVCRESTCSTFPTLPAARETRSKFPRGAALAFADHREARRVSLAVESGPVRFGELIPGEPAEIEGAIRTRVHSARPWILELVPYLPLRIVDRGGLPVPQSRLAWRSRETGNYRVFDGVMPVVVARGGATGPAGEVVVVDLRLLLGDNDELGRYECAFNLILEGL